jgi:hypothetical protein
MDLTRPLVKFELKKTPSRSEIKILLNKSETTGRVMDNKVGVVGVMKSVVTPENIYHFEQALTQSLAKSVKHLSRQLNLGASPTVCEIVSVQNSNAACPS